MHILTSKYWNHFKKTIVIKDKNKIVKDGRKFENLIKTILDLEYGHGRWKETSETWDGSRDFEWKEPDYYRWAECKNYETSISLNVISNTLVMALVDFADEILLFSYSKIKRPVINKLIQYADISHKVLRIYADESLETIILKHMPQLKDQFFPEFDLTEYNLNFQPYVSCNIVSDPVLAYTINYDDGNIPKKPNEINFPSTLCLSVFIINWTDEKKTFKLDIDWSKCEHCFEMLDSNKTIIFELNPNSTINKKIYSVENVVRALYVFTDNAYFYIDETEDEILIKIDRKKDAKLSEDELKGEIKNELLAQIVRSYVRDNTMKVRNLVYQRAMASSLILDEAPNNYRVEGDYNIDEILRDWFDKE